MESKNKNNKLVWAGRTMSTLVVLPFVFSAFMKFSGSPKMLEGWTHLGWPVSMITWIAILEVICVLLYVIPQVSILGAILLTGYIGGAISTHLRIGEPVVMQVVFGLLIWGGLFYREPRLREILPVRRQVD